MKTDILVEPELTKDWETELGRIYTVYQTWMSGYTASVHLESLQGLARYGRRDTCVKTDILVEPELTTNWET